MIGDSNDQTKFPHELLLPSPLMKNVLTPLAKSVLIPLGLTAAASAADAGIHKNILASGNNTTLIISNKDMDDLIKIVKLLEESGLLLKGPTE